jgi:hypothetical protein
MLSVLLCVAIATVVVSVHGAVNCSDPTNALAANISASVKQRLHYSDTRYDWLVEKEGSEHVAVGAPGSLRVVRESLRGRRLLFVGDSTVRNAAISLIASTCNPFWRACSQLATWQPKPGIGDALTCEGAPSQRGDGVKNTCATAISVRVVPIVNLTSSRLPRSKMERKWMWKNGILPPLVRVTLHELNAVIDVVEAGCAGGGDGLWLVFRHLLRSRGYRENVTASHLLSEAHDVESSAAWGEGSETHGLFALRLPPLARYDAVLTSAGLHCTYKHYRAGAWYRHLRRSWHLVTAFAPVVWLEVAHCLKDNTGHFFAYGGKQRLNYKKLASCPFIDSHVGTMNDLFANVSGVFISPTRFISAGLKKVANASRPPSEAELKSSRCLYADYLHPTLTCYAAMNRVHIDVLREALRWQQRRHVSDCFTPERLRAHDRAGNRVDFKSREGPSELHDEDTFGEALPPKAATANSNIDQPSDVGVYLALIAAGVMVLPAMRWARRRCFNASPP